MAARALRTWQGSHCLLLHIGDLCCLFLHVGDLCCLFFHLNLAGDLFDLNLCAVKGCLSLSPPLSAHCE